VLINDVRRGARSLPPAGVGPAVTVAAVASLLVGLQLVAVKGGFQGPVHSLVSDYLATPKSATLPWAGLGLALVGLPNRLRAAALAAAAGLDGVFFVARAWRTGVVAVGNGPLIVLTGLALVAGLGWSGRQRSNALRAIGWGLLLIVASKAADTWQRITALIRPSVFDEYALVADHAFAQPSWLAGRVLDVAGPIPYAMLHWIYIELPVAAMVVAIYQLRGVADGGWPRHHLMRTFVVLGLVGPVIYLLFPVVGPIFAFGADGAGFQVGNYWPDVLPPFGFAPHTIVFDNVTARNCMPSMHLGWALIVFIHSRKAPPWLRWGGTVWLVGTVIATLGFGYHYGVDLVAGAVLCLTVEAALREPERGWDGLRVGLVAGGATFLTVLLVCYRWFAVPMAQAPLLFGPLIIGVLVVFSAAFFARPKLAPAEPALRAPSLR
jgi:hypothetical protein